MRHHTWNPRIGQPSNRCKIRIIDNYTRFYLKSIRGAVDKVKAGLRALPANLHTLFGLQFENLMLNRSLLLSELGVRPEEIVREGPYFQTNTTKHAGCQIVWLIQTRYSLFEEVKQKVKALVTPKNLSVRPVLVHVNGAAESLQSADYFDRIIDFGKLVAETA